MEAMLNLEPMGELVMMENFIKSQVEASERLYKIMLEDHNQRTKDNIYTHQIIDSLNRKLEKRDALIEDLRHELKRVKSKMGAI